MANVFSLLSAIRKLDLKDQLILFQSNSEVFEDGGGREVS